jgi:glycosyltransferase involved in cell wall biosynthesis
MRFAVDAHAIGRHLTGNEVYVRSLLNGFASLDHSSEFLAYLSTEDASPWVPARFEKQLVSANPIKRLGWDLAASLRRDGADLLHVQYTAPLGCPAPVVVSVHDVSFLEHPEYFPSARALQLRWTVKRTVRSAARILTGSEFSRDSILRAYRLPEENVVVVPNAAAPGFRPVAREGAAAFVASRYRIPTPYILTVGDLQPRKNHTGLIKAFASLVQAHPRLRHCLLIAGKDTWYGNEVYAAAKESGVGGRIHFTGFVADEDLLQIYNAADLFVFPSFYEGFGLPILEAMACGRAVACSSTSAMPEVADGAAILFDPASTDSMAGAMADLLLDAGLRVRMETLGIQRAGHFSWRKTAQKTLEVYREVAENGSRRGAMRPAAVAAG